MTNEFAYHWSNPTLRRRHVRPGQEETLSMSFIVALILLLLCYGVLPTVGLELVPILRCLQTQEESIEMAFEHGDTPFVISQVFPPFFKG